MFKVDEFCNILFICNCTQLKKSSEKSKKKRKMQKKLNVFETSLYSKNVCNLHSEKNIFFFFLQKTLFFFFFK